MRTKSAWLVPLVLLGLCWPGHTQGLTDLDTNCIVSILNRSARVRADGTWHIDNVPSNFGLVRVRATCVRNGITFSGQSDFISLEANLDNGFSPFALGTASAIPSSLTITVPAGPLTASNATAQLTVTATYPDGTTRNVTTATNGTSYTISNPAFITLSADGLVTAKKSGVVIVSAANEGAVAFGRVSVVLSGVDSDGDGIPDDIELANGLDPHNPADAEEDPDGDGLTNFQELMIYGTNPRLADTDGDGISDGDEVSGRLGFVTNPLLADSDGDGINDLLEIQTGSNPNDRTSYNLARALESIEVTPAAFVLTVNTIVGEASRQLSVIGHLRDGTTIDLASTTRGTVYSSDNLFIANFGAPDGNVFAGTNGTATITVSNSTFMATAAVTVRTSTPRALGFVAIPGFANGVDISGRYAYVAAGATGLQVVDVSDRSNPRVVAALDTPGNADDVKIVGNLAFVADGPAGLQILSVANPLAPVLVGTVDTPGDAMNLVVAGNYAYVADGSAGLQIIDVSTPSAPRIVNSVATLGTANGVAVRGNLAVIANGAAGILTVDITDPTQPNVLGTLSYGSDARNVTVQNNFVFVADYSRSFTSIEITDPQRPVYRSSTALDTGGRLLGVALSGRFAFGADVLFVNGIPIIDIANPTNPVPRAILDFSAFRDDNGTGVAVDNSYVYLTTDHNSLSGKGTTGDSRLYIGQYLAIEDTRGIPPIVRIISPVTGVTVIEGQSIPVTVAASDDVEVSGVSLLANGVVVASDFIAPYEFTFTAPAGTNRVILNARATDFGGNTGVAPDITLNIIPDPGTTVTGTVVDSQTNAIAGAAVAVFGTYTNITGVDGQFAIANVPTVRGNIAAAASAVISNVLFSGSSRSVPPVPGGVTLVGDIVLVQGQFETNYGASLAQCDDCFVPVSLPFAFPFFGQTYSNCFFDGNGRVSFNFGSGDYTESIPKLSAQPLISVLWNDWDARGIAGSGIFYNGSLPGRAVFTWLKLSEFPASQGKPVVTIQIVLFSDGRIQFGYDGVNVPRGVTGISPGPGFPTQVVNFRSNLVFSVTNQSVVAQEFTPPNPFDLDHGFILWTPNGSGGFDVRTVLPSSAPAPIAGAGGPLLTGHSLFIERLVDGSMRVHGLAEKGARYAVEASENLIEWRPIATNIAGTNLWNYIDSAAANLNKCFYRAVKQ